MSTRSLPQTSRLLLGCAIGTVWILPGASPAGEDRPAPRVPPTVENPDLPQAKTLPPPPITQPRSIENPRLSNLPTYTRPTPPTPPPPPVPTRTTTYYTTCGGAHNPVPYTVSTYDPADVKKYNEDFAKYVQEVEDYNRKYGNSASARPGNRPPAPSAPDAPEPVDDGPVSPEPESQRFMGYDLNPESESPNTLQGGTVVAKVNRDPRQDLARWFRGSLYHDPAAPAVYGGGPEPAAGLEQPDAGPAAQTSLYARLVRWLNAEAQAGAPAPGRLVASLDALWEGHWRRNLGFDADPAGRQIVGDIERAAKDAASAKQRHEQLVKKAGSDELEKLRLNQQLEFTVKEAQAAAAKEETLREELAQRVEFIAIVTALLRLAPDGGFGPTFLEGDLKAIQASASRILGAIGPLAAEPVWKGLAKDVEWLAKNSSGGERERRAAAVEAAEGVLADSRVGGLSAVCDFLVKAPKGNAEVIRKALELLDRLGTKTLRAETLTTLPTLIGLMKDDNAVLAERGRWTLLRVLSVREGRASMEEAIGTIAPLLKSMDSQLIEAADQFLQAHTGQNLGRDPAAWKRLQEHMTAERLKAKSAQARATK